MPSTSVCLFCEQKGDLHKAPTMEIDRNVRKCAIEVRDTKVFTAKLSACDMVAIEAEYHRDCLIELYRRYDKVTKTSDEDDSVKSIHDIAFA